MVEIRKMKDPLIADYRCGASPFEGTGGGTNPRYGTVDRGERFRGYRDVNGYIAFRRPFGPSYRVDEEGNTTRFENRLFPEEKGVCAFSGNGRVRQADNSAPILVEEGSL